MFCGLLSVLFFEESVSGAEKIGEDEEESEDDDDG